jgi:Dolichyl-phosphate-mannose-protein mannosyltransferase
VAARLILIDQPFVDHWSWRQSDVAAIARNFFEHGFHFGYPQIDWAGGSAGYVGTEFPILPFLAAICYKFTGVHEWISRSQSVIFFAVSFPFFFLLVRESFGSLAASWATFFYAFAPLNLFAGRSFMPDVPSLSLAIIGLYFFQRWVCDRRLAPFYLSAIAISLSILIKATSIVIATPILYLAVAGIGDPGPSQTRLVPGRDHRSRLQLLSFFAIALVPSAIWYWHAHQIANKFYPHHFFGAGGIRIEGLAWYWHIAQQALISSFTPVLSLMAVIGLFVPQSRNRRYTRLFDWWLAAMVLFIIFVGYGNRHLWYQLPLVPIAAAFAGVICALLGSKISSRVVAVTLTNLVVGSFEFFALWYVQPFYQSSAAQLRNAGLELNKMTAPDALIVAADMGDPTIFYYAQRKGWHFPESDGIYDGTPDDSEQAIEDFERLRRRGATHFVFTRNTFWWLRSYLEFDRHLAQNAILIEATPEFKIYKLAPTTK